MFRKRMAVAALSALSLLAACGRSGGTNTNTSGNIDPLKGLQTTTAPGTKRVDAVTWAVYRDVNSVDPIFAFDYPENTAVSLMCESLLRQSPSGEVGPNEVDELSSPPGAAGRRRRGARRPRAREINWFVLSRRGRCRTVPPAKQTGACRV